MPEITIDKTLVDDWNNHAKPGLDINLTGFDIETSMRGPDHARASAFFGNNSLCMAWTLHMEDDVVVNNWTVSSTIDGMMQTLSCMLCGHNLKFDLGFLRAKELLSDATLYNLKVWDTQIAQYLLSGQRDKFPSLEYTCQQWDVPYLKDPDVTAAIERGEIEKIPLETLHKYCAHDAYSARSVAAKQIKVALKSGQLDLILSQMQAMLAVMECEVNGLKIDPAHFIILNTSIEDEKEKALETLSGIALHATGGRAVDYMWDSPKFVAALLYGGTVQEHYEETKTYKNGKSRVMRKTRDLWIDGLRMSPPATTPGGAASVSSDTIEELLLIYPGHEFLEALLKYRELIKVQSTYTNTLASYADKSWIIHHTLHQTATATGRLSSSRPNLQNVPINKEYNVKNGFTSRFGSNGVLVEVDYKQIEVLFLAYITGDPVLKSDIIDGRDIHTEVGKEVYGHSMSKEERRIVKTINFGLIYGAGVPTLVKQSRQPERVVKPIVESFYRRYSQVKVHNKQFNSKLSADITSSKVFANPEKDNAKLVYHQSNTGRMFWFQQSDYTSWDGKPQVSYTQTCNYPVQGSATGDFVPATLGRIFRLLMNKPEWKGKVYLINTVHDNIMFDVHNDVRDEFLPWIKAVMEDGGSYFNKTFSLGGELAFDLPVKVEITYGPTWGDQKEWT